jgi:hypothetical protein
VTALTEPLSTLGSVDFLLKITACGSVISTSNSSTTMPLWAIALIVERPALRAKFYN